MKKIINIIVLLFFSLTFVQAQTTKSIVKAKYTAEKQTKLLKRIIVSEGDVLTLTVKSLHKRKGLNIWAIQSPGSLLVFHHEDMMEGTKQITAPADAIYLIYFNGKNFDFEVEITQTTNKPDGPQKGKLVYVQIPDTLHQSGYVNYSIGQSYSLTPYTEKVLLSVKKQPEQIISRDFITGVDFINVEIPGNVKDEYRHQKLLSYSVTLTCGELSMYNAMMGVVDAGIDLALDKVSGAAKNKMKGKPKKGSFDSQYDFTTKDLDAESSKIETLTEVVEISSEKSAEYSPDSKGSKALETTAFVLDGGIQEVIIEKAMDEAGVPKDIQAIYSAIQEFPDVADIVKDNVHKLIPKAKGKASILVEEKVMATYNYPVIPAGKTFWIQSAMNYGKNQSGYFDVPGHPTKGEKGQNIKVWDIDQGADRKFTIAPSGLYQGHYEILSTQTGNMVLDVSNGEINKNSANIQLWERNNSDAQQFFLKHMGNGRFKIYTIDYVVCLDGRKNANGTNVHLWEDHEGAWTEWYLVDPATGQAFIPTEERPYKRWERNTVLNKEGSVVTEIVKVDSTAGETKKLYITIGQQGAAAKAKLLVEANYEITDYTDVIKYKRTTQDVKTKDFWTAYKVRYDYQMMFEDQVREGWNIISENDFYSSSRPSYEVLKTGDEQQRIRLEKFDILSK